MTWLEALILGILQGLTEFLPVSSSGHLELGKVLLGVEAAQNIEYTVVVHGATVLSTIVVFRKDILALFRGLFSFQWNEETRYILNLIISMIPVAIVGLFFKDEVESFFDGNIQFVGFMLLFTAALLTFAYYKKSGNQEIRSGNAFFIGLAQALAVLPGISRSGSTIAVGLITGVKKELIAKFSFLMVLVPIIGANVKDIFDGSFQSSSGVGTQALAIGFIAAFISGLLACQWMVNLVKRGKLIYFALYCLIVGIIAILAG